MPEDSLNDSDIEIHGQIKKSITDSMSRDRSSYCKSFGAEFIPSEPSKNDISKAGPLESNYVTFGTAYKGRRTENSIKTPSINKDLPNYSTNACSELEESRN
mmetsp:Transcript_5934/g.5095  ORF Transcript_5934/g.5095 Transcript_5934/m.5095 type:complete len:102 (+) Transcript_5934:524-829(+)